MKDEDKTIFIIILLLLVVGGFFYYYNPTVKTKSDIAVSTIASVVNLQQGIQYAGYVWDATIEPLTSHGFSYCTSSACEGASGEIYFDEKGFIIIKSVSSSSATTTGAGSMVCINTREDISDIDEFLIIWEGTNSISGHSSLASSSMSFGLYDKTTDTYKKIKETGEADVDPEVTKFMNNFDKTYTALSYLGVGDLFIKDFDIDVKDFKSVHLRVCQSTTAKHMTAYGGSSSTGTMKLINVVTKRLETPICKADKILLPNGSCENLENILLAREEAIYESLEEKIARIEARLQAREEGLQNQLDELKDLIVIEDKQAQIDLLNKKLADLQAELASTQQSEKINEINKQIEFNKLQLELLLSTKTESDERIEYLAKELQLTNQILTSIQSGDLMPPPDVDIEEVIKKVLDKIEVEEKTSGEALTDAEIQALINSEINKQFEERFPTGLIDKTEKFPVIPAIIIIGIIALLALLFSGRRN